MRWPLLRGLVGEVRHRGAFPAGPWVARQVMIPTLLLQFALGGSPEDVGRRLETGEIIVTVEAVPGSSVPRARMQAVIEAPPEKVWAIVDDCGNYRRTMPRIAASAQLERDAGTVTCQVTAALPFPLPNLTSETRAVIVVEPGVRWSRTWTMLKGDYVTNNGSWVLTPYRGDPARTLVSYEIHVDPNIHLPQAMITQGQKTSLPRVIERLREQTVGK